MSVGPLTAVAIVRLCAASASYVDPGTCAAFVQAESGGNPLAIHDNATGESIRPASVEEAVEAARRLLDQRHSIDVGLGQINSANFAATGLTIETAFDPAANLRAAEQILVEGYKRCLHGRELPNAGEQDAVLRCMASIYNTGDERRGIRSGYVARVWKAAERIVPAIRAALDDEKPEPAEDAQPSEPPSWDVWAGQEEPEPPQVPMLAASEPPVAIASAPADPPPMRVNRSAPAPDAGRAASLIIAPLALALLLALASRGLARRDRKKPLRIINLGM